MPDLTSPDAKADMVVKYRLAPLLYWAIFGALFAFMAVMLAQALEPDPGAPPMGWFDWVGFAAIAAAAAFFAWVPFRVPMTWLTLGADGSVRLATRTPFAARERRLEPGSVARVELRRNVFGLLHGWQIILHWQGGGRMVLNERGDGAAQAALAREIERRLGVGGAS